MKLEAENEELRRRLEEAEETLRAIRTGTVDAFVVSGADGEQIYTLESADRPYRLLVEKMHQAAVTLSTKGTIVYSNRRLAVLLGVAHPRLAGAALADFVPPEDRPVYEAMVRAGKSGSSHCEISLSRADGARIPVVISSNELLQDSGAALGMLITDLTSQKAQEKLAAAHEALRESEVRFRTMADNISQLAWMADGEGRTFWYNQRWFDYTGTTLNEMKGWGWKAVHHPDHIERVVEKVARHFREGIDWEDTFPLRGKDGAYRWFLSRMKAIRDESGNIVRYFGTNTDITALREAEAQLADRAVHLEQLVQERTAKLNETIGDLETFSYSLVHDLRAPLRAMNNFARLLAEECGPVSATAQDYVQRMTGAASRMDLLIQDVLNYSRVARDELPLAAVDVGALLAGIVATYPAFQPPHAAVQLEGAFPQVRANEAGLTQCISNLLGNAVKFVGPGIMPRVRVWAQTNHHRVRLLFQDNGIGIEKDAHETIFQMFQRLNKRFEGTGIGLTIVRKAIEKMSGRVGLESELGKGSTFWLELEEAKSEAHPVVPGPPGGERL